MMPQISDPVTGPLTRAQLQSLAAAPFGEATKAIRKHDPFWGRTEGEKIKWKVTCRRDDEGVAYVNAASEKEANDLADDLSSMDVDWDDCAGGMEIVSVEPDIERK